MKHVLVAVLASGIAFATAANAKTYSCSVVPDNSRHWIPRTLLINIDDQSGDILVYDDIVKRFLGKPLAAAPSAETGKRITIKWTVRRVRDDYGQSSERFFFRASYYKDSGKLIMSSIPGGWDNMFGGRGRCKVSMDSNWANVLANTPVATFNARGKARFTLSDEQVWLWN